MRKLIAVAGNIAGVLGLLVCLVSGGARVLGQFYLLGYEAMTLFVGGIGLMVAACLAELHLGAIR